MTADLFDASPVITVACDGGAAPNPGKGGWAYAIVAGPRTIEAPLPESFIAEACGGVPHATNNQMELQAAINALQNPAVPNGATVVLMQDSQYVLKGLTEWMHGWKRNGWKTSKGKPVENQALWIQLDAARNRFKSLTAQWVRGHAGHPLNEYVDGLVEQGRLSV